MSAPNTVTPAALPTAASIRAARERTKGQFIVTPTLHRPALSQFTGCEVFVKYENMQHTGAFKARGAIAKLTTLSDAQKKAGVVAMSAGNHAQGIAFHARRLGIPATIVMPRGTPFDKIRKTGDYGGKVVLEGDDFAEAAVAARRMAEERGLLLIHPYDDVEVISGQGVIGMEMLEAAPDLDAIVVPIGGGGLIAGIALAAREIKPEVEIVGIETELYPAMINSLARGNRPCGGATMAEGIALREVGGFLSRLSGTWSRKSSPLPKPTSSAASASTPLWRKRLQRVRVRHRSRRCWNTRSGSKAGKSASSSQAAISTPACCRRCSCAI